MNMIKVEWELTPNQRSILLNALLHHQAHLDLESDLEDTEMLVSLVSKLKCGDPYCNYCAAGPYNAKWDE